MNRLRVEKSNIVNEDGDEVILEGVCTNSPGILIEEDHDILQDIQEIQKLEANTVKIPICPAYWQANKNYCTDILDPIVSRAKSLGLYCCLDWHAQGNPYTNTTRKHGNEAIHGFEKYDARKEVAFSALETLSKKYGSEPHVLFDVFSMPIDITVDHWISVVQKLVDIARKHTSNIVVVNGTNWASDISWVLETPIEAENIVYGRAYYPLEMFKDTTDIREVKKKYPVVLSECGYTPDGYFEGTKQKYGKNLKQLISRNNLSFFAWAYHPERVPVLLNSWDPNDLSEWGMFLKKEIINK